MPDWEVCKWGGGCHKIWEKITKALKWDDEHCRHFWKVNFIPESVNEGRQEEDLKRKISHCFIQDFLYQECCTVEMADALSDE